MKGLIGGWERRRSRASVGDEWRASVSNLLTRMRAHTELVGREVGECASVRVSSCCS